MKMPKYTLNDTAMLENDIIKYASDYITLSGFDYVDFSEFLFNGESTAGNPIGISPETDYYDHFHLNHLGAEKFSSYLSNYLKNKYNFDFTHEKEVKDHWDLISSETKVYYEELKNSTLNGKLYTGCELDFCKKYDK